MPITSDEFKLVMAGWASGITVVTTNRPDGIHGMTATSFCSVSMDPPLILVCIDKGNRTHDLIAQEGCFGVNLLAEGQEEISNQAAGFTGRTGNHLEDVPMMTAQTGAPVLTEALAWMDCSLWASYPGGDHDIYVGQVEASGVAPEEAEAQPLLWFSRGYRTLSD